MIVIHPGMVKSATTSLQNLVFAQHPEITYLGLPAPNEDAKRAIRHICRADSIDYDPTMVQAVLEPLAAGAKGPAVLSYENFALYESKDKGLIANRLHQLFPEAKVMFTIRRQEDVLAAWYLQKMQNYVRHGHYLSFEEWFALKSKLPHRSILDDLRYFEIISCYARLYGQDNVRVFLFERLRSEAQAFSRDLGRFLGVDGQVIEQLLAERRENPTIPERLVWLGRHAFPLLPKAASRKIANFVMRRGGPPARVQVDGPIAAAVRDLCAAGNRRLAADYGLPLQQYGYSL